MPRQNQISSPKQKQICRYCCSNHAPRQYLAYRKTYGECSKMNYLKAVCKSTSTRQKIVSDMEQDIGANNQFDMVNITSFNLYSIRSIIIEHLKLTRARIVQS